MSLSTGIATLLHGRAERIEIVDRHAVGGCHGSRGSSRPAVDELFAAAPFPPVACAVACAWPETEEAVAWARAVLPAPPENPAPDPIPPLPPTLVALTNMLPVPVSLPVAIASPNAPAPPVPLPPLNASSVTSSIAGELIGLGIRRN